MCVWGGKWVHLVFFVDQHPLLRLPQLPHLTQLPHLQSGSILMDGVDIRQYNLRWLRSQVGLVSQVSHTRNTEGRAWHSFLHTPNECAWKEFDGLCLVHLWSLGVVL
jgi:hypothetical protein